MMSREEVLNQVTNIIREEFDDEGIEVTYDTVANDVDGWDSLSHISIVHAMESTFKIRFTMAEVQSLKNVGEYVDAIIRHAGE